MPRFHRVRSRSSFLATLLPDFGPKRTSRVVDVGWHSTAQRRLTTPLRRLVAGARRRESEAQGELVAFFAPHRAWLLARYSGSEAEADRLEQAANAAILDAVIHYPERYLQVPPWITLVDWVERTLDRNFRRRQRLWPYDNAEVYERAEYRAQWLASRHNAAGDALRLRVSAEIKRGKMRTGPPSNHDIEPPPAGLGPRLQDMTLVALLVEAKTGAQDARAEVCRRFTRLVRKLTSPYSLPQEDLEQRAMIAVLEAIDEYDRDKGTFAQLVIWRVKDALRDVVKSEPPPMDNYSEEQPDEETGAVPGSVARAVARLVHSWYEEDTGVWGGGPIWQGSGKGLTMAMADVLDESERTLLERLFGLPGHEKTTQQELARELGVTQQAVSKRVKKAIARLEQVDWRAIYYRCREDDPLDY